MIGSETLKYINRMQLICNELGFELKPSKYGTALRNRDVIALVAKGLDAFPIYSRDAELYVGTLEEIEQFIAGIKWSRQYDQLLKVSDDKKRERKEQDYRNSELLRMLKQEVDKPNKTV